MYVINQSSWGLREPPLPPFINLNNTFEQLSRFLESCARVSFFLLLAEVSGVASGGRGVQKQQRKRYLFRPGGDLLISGTGLEESVGEGVGF